MESFCSLPAEIQIEIFSFLSLKHLATILSLNKSIHHLADSNTSFWHVVLRNYSKLIHPKSNTLEQQINQALSDQNVSSLNIEKYSTLLQEMIKTKKRNVEALTCEIEAITMKMKLFGEKMKQVEMEFTQLSMHAGQNKRFEVRIELMKGISKN